MGAIETKGAGHRSSAFRLSVGGLANQNLNYDAFVFFEGIPSPLGVREQIQGQAIFWIVPSRP